MPYIYVNLILKIISTKFQVLKIISFNQIQKIYYLKKKNTHYHRLFGTQGAC